MPDCQSGAVHSLGCGTVIGIAVAGDFSVFVTLIVTRGERRKGSCEQGCSSVICARLFRVQRDGQQVGARNSQADKLLQSSQEGASVAAEGILDEWASITSL